MATNHRELGATCPVGKNMAAAPIDGFQPVLRDLAQHLPSLCLVYDAGFPDNYPERSARLRWPVTLVPGESD